MSGAVVAVACGVLILLAATAGYVAGTRRRAPRHGIVQQRAGEPASTRRAPRHGRDPKQS